jgi:hypothetical protein
MPLQLQFVQQEQLAQARTGLRTQLVVGQALGRSLPKGCWVMVCLLQQQDLLLVVVSCWPGSPARRPPGQQG